MSEANIEVQNYFQAVKDLKSAILKSRYNAARLVNKELLTLYYFVGCYVSLNTRNNYWGTGAINKISELLQQELQGLRGFSASNLKNMRGFYEEWKSLELNLLSNSNISLFDFMNHPNRQNGSGDLDDINSQNHSGDLMKDFFSIGFSHHLLVIQYVKDPEVRWFYIKMTSRRFWELNKLKQQLIQGVHININEKYHNFNNTIPEPSLKENALKAFKNELLLDFINIEDADEEPDERILEKEIVQNIKKFIMALGPDFCFIGSQFRLIIEEEEFFIDLLFFNRTLQSLIAIELKKGKFKAEYVGKMNLYLSGLDEYVKKPNENASIGIILCKEKKSKIVEFALRDSRKPMGVVTYKTQHELPEKYKKVLPDIEGLRNLL